MSRSTVSVGLYLDRASDPISGSMVYPDGRKLAFAGWIELTAALEEARRCDPLEVVAHGQQRAPARPAENDTYDSPERREPNEEDPGPDRR